jgi:hypothetical protein
LEVLLLIAHDEKHVSMVVEGSEDGMRWICETCAMVLAEMLLGENIWFAFSDQRMISMRFADDKV